MTMFRHWRIQVSLICFTLLLGVIVLWERSYHSVDVIGWVINPTTSCNVRSYHGYISFNKSTLPASTVSTMPNQSIHVSINSSPELDAAENRQHFDVSVPGVYRYSNSFSSHFGISYWFPAIFMAVLTGLPRYWRRFNFSLRTFFIAFTILAVALGLIGWVFR
jgi:hypothetical protein